MFDNLGWWEIALVVVLALFLFGPDRLPKLINDIGRFLRGVRRMARDASADLSEELGSDVDIADLHPKRFVRRHLLSDDDVTELRRPFDEIADEVRGARADVEGALRGHEARQLDSAKPTAPGAEPTDPEPSRVDPDTT